MCEIYWIGRFLTVALVFLALSKAQPSSCQLKDLFISREPTATAIVINTCSLEGEVLIRNGLSLIVITGGGAPNATLYAPGTLRLAPGAVLFLSNITVTGARFSSNFLNISSFVSASSVQLKNCTIVTNCYDLGQQLSLVDEELATKVRVSANSLWIPGQIAIGSITAEGVRVQCTLPPIQSSLSRSQGGPADPGLSFAVDSTETLFNAMAALNHLDTGVDSIFVRSDIVIQRAFWPLGIILTRNQTYIYSEPRAQLWIDWRGETQLFRVRVNGTRTAFVNLDHINFGPLNGYYQPFVGQSTLFIFPCWIMENPSQTLHRGFNPVVIINGTMVVPPDEYSYLVTMTLVTTSPVGPVAQAAARMRIAFGWIEPSSKLNAANLNYDRMEGLGLAGFNLTIQANLPARAAGIQQLWRDAGTPPFAIDIFTSNVLVATVNCYTVEDLMSGLQMLQDSPTWEPMVNIMVWSNLSLAEVKDKWPTSGYQLGMNITLFGVPPGEYPTRAYSIIDLAGITNFITAKPGIKIQVNYLYMRFVNIPLVPPIPSLPPFPFQQQNPTMTGFDSSLLSERTALSLNFAGMQGTFLFFNNSLLVIPISDFEALRDVATQQPRANLSGFLMRGGLVLGSSIRFSLLQVPGSWSATNLVVTHEAVAPFPVSYTNSLRSPPSPSPLAANSDSGSKSSDVVGIAVGCAVGGTLVIALIALSVLFYHHRKLKTQNQSQGSRSSDELKSEEFKTEAHEGKLPSTPTHLAKSSGKGVTSHGQKSVEPPENSEKMIELHVTGDNGNNSGSDTKGELANHLTPPDELHKVMMSLTSDIDDKHLVILDILGQGGFGTVYKGQWKGIQVAVKTLVFQDTVIGDGKGQHTALFEAAISASLAHPNVVITYSYDLKPLQVPLNHGSSQGDPATRGGFQITHQGVSDWKLYIIQEYCDAGSLRQAVLRKKLWDDGHGMPNMEYVLDCAKELAAGLAHIHSKGIVHGDLNPNNVLLKRERSSRRGVVCKLCDFGLSIRLPHGQSHISNMRRGTPFYTAPEVITKGNMTTAADCFSYGVMLWEMISSQTCYKAHPDGSFTQRDNFPLFEPHCPRDFRLLTMGCLDSAPSRRPTMVECVNFIESMQAKLADGSLWSSSLPEGYSLYQEKLNGRLGEGGGHVGNGDSLGDTAHGGL